MSEREVTISIRTILRMMEEFDKNKLISLFGMETYEKLTKAVLSIVKGKTPGLYCRECGLKVHVLRIDKRYTRLMVVTMRDDEIFCCVATNPLGLDYPCPNCKNYSMALSSEIILEGGMPK